MLDNSRIDEAIASYRRAIELYPSYAEPHFNLGIAYERRGMLDQAEQQMLLSLQIDPTQVDAHNTLGAIYAEEGKYMRAHDEWTELVEANPDYAPARANLNILRHVERTGLEGLSPQSGFARGR